MVRVRFSKTNIFYFTSTDGEPPSNILMRFIPETYAISRKVRLVRHTDKKLIGAVYVKGEGERERERGEERGGGKQDVGFGG